METVGRNKEVLFSEYCPKCKHFRTPEWEKPCHECLSVPTRDGTRVPENYERKGVARRNYNG